MQTPRQDSQRVCRYGRLQYLYSSCSSSRLSLRQYPHALSFGTTQRFLMMNRAYFRTLNRVNWTYGLVHGIGSDSFELHARYIRYVQWIGGPKPGFSDYAVMNSARRAGAPQTRGPRSEPRNITGARRLAPRVREAAACPVPECRSWLCRFSRDTQFLWHRIVTHASAGICRPSALRDPC